jgi:peptidoglycan/LPS O-acetylase OafA/YrhL
MKENNDLKFKRILSIFVFIVLMIAFLVPAFLGQRLNDVGKVGLSVLQDTTVFWCTAILGYYFGSNLVKSFLNNGKPTGNPLSEEEKNV